MLDTRPDGSIREVPPDRCSAPGCDEIRLRPGWGECPHEDERGRCGAMDRTYECSAGHVTMADWHQHRIVPSERPRWHCRTES